MAVIQLKGSPREQIGKGAARKARAAGRIPAVIYGHGETPRAIAVDFREFEVALRDHKGSNAIVNLSTANCSGESSEFSGGSRTKFTPADAASSSKLGQSAR